jgi:acetyl esterase/lipase
MRCMLYLHGGGYYFGSIDQERYIMQRLGRKMGGRVFGPYLPQPDLKLAHFHSLQP